MNENQRIRSGDESENYQSANDITVNHNYGISYEAAKDIAMTVFENNFIKLGEQVEEIVSKRAEKLVNDYLEKIRSENPEALKNTVDPDIRAGIYEAQKDYARSGKEEVEKLLVDLLVERTINVDSDFKNILLNEALSVAAKLSKAQIDLLTIHYFFTNLFYSREDSPDVFETALEPFLYLFYRIASLHSDLHFLSYLGCLSLSIGKRDFNKILSSKNIIGLSSDEEIKKNINNFENISRLKAFYENPSNQLSGATSTPVGDVIAITNFNKLYKDYKLSYSF